MGVGPDGGFRPVGPSRRPWTSAEPIRRIVRHAFAAAGLSNCNPHSLRKTLATYQHEVCTALEEQSKRKSSLY
jgi:hypothetical protein